MRSSSVTRKKDILREQSAPRTEDGLHSPQSPHLRIVSANAKIPHARTANTSAACNSLQREVVQASQPSVAKAVGLNVENSPSPKQLRRSLASSSQRMDFVTLQQRAGPGGGAQGAKGFYRRSKLANATSRLAPLGSALLRRGSAPGPSSQPTPALRTGGDTNGGGGNDGLTSGRPGFARATAAAPAAADAARDEEIRELHRELSELRASLAGERTMRLDLEERLRKYEERDSEAAGAAPRATGGEHGAAAGEEGASTGGSAAPDEAPIPAPMPPDAATAASFSSPFRKRRLSRDSSTSPFVFPLDAAANAAAGRRPRERHGAKDAKAKGVGEALVEEGGVGNDVSDDVSASAPATAAVVAPGAIAFAPEMGEEQEASPIPPELRAAYGTFSCHGVEPIERPDGTCVEEAKINQDCAGVAYPVGGRADAALFCVYDGHGEHGHVVSRAALNGTHSALENGPLSELLAEAPPEALAQAFTLVQSQLSDEVQRGDSEGDAKAAQAGGGDGPAAAPAIDARESGACALACYLRRDTLWVANAGDCRAVLGTTREGALSAVSLSTDHKPDAPAEQRRIEAHGGAVRPARGEGTDDYMPARLFQDLQRPWLGPGLAMSRAIGDLNAERCGLVATPEVIEHRVDTAHDDYLIIASDGVWEFITPEAAVELVHKAIAHDGQAPTDACRILIATAALAWRKFEGDYRDDITAIVLHLPRVVAELGVAKHDDEEESGNADAACDVSSREAQ